MVVASVFAFTVLSTGIFSSERGKETVFAGIQEAQSTLEPRGSLIAYTGKIGATSTTFKMSFLVSNAVAGAPVDLSPLYSADGSGDDPDIIAGARQVTVISYRDKEQFIGDVPWSVSFPGSDDGDTVLENNEKAEITIWLLTRDNTVTDVSANDSLKVLTNAIDSTANILAGNDEFTLEIKPASGAVLNLKRILPAFFDTVMDLN